MPNGMKKLVEKSSLQENHQPMERSSLEQNSLGEKHGQSEPMEIESGSVGSDLKVNCIVTGYSTQRQNELREENKVGPKHVPSESMKTAVIGSDPQENYLPAECLYPSESSIQENNNSGEVHVVGTENITRGQNLLCEDQELMIKNGSSFGSINEQNELMGSSRDFGSDVQESCRTGKCSSPNHNKLEEKQELGFENEGGAPTIDSMVIGGSDAQEKCQVTGSASLKQIGLVEKHEVGSEDVEGKPTESKVAGPDSIDVELTPDVGATKNSNHTARKGKIVSARSVKRKYMLRSSSGSTRNLRTRLGSTSKRPDLTSVTLNVTVSDARKGKRKRRMMKKVLNDEYSRIRKHLRYFLNRMGYEHSLIDAYSGEGWKGQSIEKIKPEMELQRATSEILRCKRRIRDLFQQLDSLCAEGRLQESLFDSEGQIYSEDIFCAKCGSKDLSADNDIILCDGICDRGFHQMCLDPPLLKEEIPPGDEGWLCPGCDCKVDCVDLLNDFRGTDLSIDDKWEKVFPEAAATEAGNTLDENFGFPSDDSEDNDYDPDGPEVDGMIETEGSTSEESDFTSASDELNLTALPLDERYSGLPSDDSEDNDYDPNAPDLDENVNKESSSSDFTSDPETFSASSCDNGTSGGDEGPVPPPINGGKSVSGLGQRTKVATNKKQSPSAELLLLQEQDFPGALSPVSGKRQIERLDYKKLHDETYGNVPSDSSDDEDWADVDAQKKRENDGNKKVSDQSPKETSLTALKKSATRGRQSNSKRRTRQKLEFDGTNDSAAAETHKNGPLPDCTGKNASASGSRRLGQAVTERLLESLKENEYPSRDTKETLAKELGITSRQVSKWFENARWSLRHSANDDAPGRAKASSSKEPTPHEQSKSPKIRNKRNHKLDYQSQTSVETSAVKNKKIEQTSADSTKARTRRQNKRQEATRLTIQTRQRKKVP